jgi:hypothetical protein
MAKRKLNLDNITQPTSTAYQVRIVRRGKETSRYFSHNLWGSKKKALDAARNWRDQVKVALKMNTRRLTKAPAHNKSTGVLGVSRTHSADNRKDLKYLVYGVGWVDHTGKKRSTAFRVCNINNYNLEIDLFTFELAKRFREEWEHHSDNDTLHLLDPKKYLNELANWKHQHE